MYRRFQSHAGQWDMIVVGGGATGVGVATDGASRGYDVLLLERAISGKARRAAAPSWFTAASGTWSRATSRW